MLILPNSELQHAVDYSENIGSEIVELPTSSSALWKKIAVAELRTSGSTLWNCGKK
jgi:hypothetical protein